jgi:hypothetical protein
MNIASMSLNPLGRITRLSWRQTEIYGRSSIRGNR